MKVFFNFLDFLVFISIVALFVLRYKSLKTIVFNFFLEGLIEFSMFLILLIFLNANSMKN